jgi:ArsR family transcriptional regulator, arsenate/arsenite/antimonite-responsive transcriptional repressor
MDDIRLLQAMADPTRLAILRELAAGDGVCACDFTACCDVSQPTVSHHLKVLREAGWVSSERRGTFIYYYLRPEALARVSQLVAQVTPARHQPKAGARQLPVVQPVA